MKALHLILAGAATVLSLPVQAQSANDVVVMRRQIAPPVETFTTQAVGPFSWFTGVWSDAGACTSTSSGKRTVECRAANGRKMADAQCSGSKPDATRSGVVTDGCTRQWTADTWSNPSPVCSDQSYRTRAVSCVAVMPDGSTSVVAPDQCPGSKPTTSEGPSSDSSGCTGEWKLGDWQTGSACVSGQKTDRRTAECQYKPGSSTGLNCLASAKPADVTRTSTCTSGLVCTTPANRWVGGGHTGYVRLGSAPTLDAAIAVCQARTDLGPGLCTFTGDTGAVGYAVGPNAYDTQISDQPSWFVSYCRLP